MQTSAASLSDHFYPLYTSRLSSAASLAHSSNKAFLAGEYDWTNNIASWLDYPLVLRRWHVSLAILVVLLPVLGALLHVFLPSSTSSFLSQSRSLGASSASPKSTGDLYWSLFGRDDTCCAYVQHSDGYTLHYPSSPAAAGGAEERGSGERVAELTRHAWGMREERPYWLQDAGKAVGDLKLLDLPVVACPQEGLTLASGSVVGG
ncbi:hypothetical protein JCM10213v2_002845 [Rhodosporidiobolus nylandii]